MGAGPQEDQRGQDSPVPPAASHPHRAKVQNSTPNQVPVAQFCLEPHGKQEKCGPCPEGREIVNKTTQMDESGSRDPELLRRRGRCGSRSSFKDRKSGKAFWRKRGLLCGLKDK